MRADIKFKFVTPCIMGGADSKASAEMRVPAIRGQLLWWSRALGYGNMPNVFGGTDGDPIASIFQIRDYTENLQWSVKNGQQVSGNKFDYFLWPMRPTNQDPSAGNRGVIDANQVIEIKISEKKVKTDVTMPSQILKSFLLLGSLGTRSRRCYGSIYPTEVTIDGHEWKIPTTIDAFKTELNSVLDSDANCYVRSLTDKPCRDYKLAIQKCADFLKAFRCGSPKSGKPSQWGENDHDARYGKASEVYRAAIGLPLNQRYSDGVNVETKIDGVDRLASPVHFKVIPLDGGFLPISITFPAHADQVVGETAKLTGRNVNKRLEVSGDLLLEMRFPDEEIWKEGECLGDFT